MPALSEPPARVAVAAAALKGEQPRLAAPPPAVPLAKLFEEYCYIKPKPT